MVGKSRRQAQEAAGYIVSSVRNLREGRVQVLSSLSTEWEFSPGLLPECGWLLSSLLKLLGNTPIGTPRSLLPIISTPTNLTIKISYHTCLEFLITLYALVKSFLVAE